MEAVAMMENSYPRSLRTLVSRLVGFHTNKFRVEPQGANSNVKAGAKISFALPSNALINLRSISLVCPKVSTDSNKDTLAVVTRMSDLIQQVNIYVNGVMITNAVQQYNTLARMLCLTDDSQDRQLSTGAVEGHDTSHFIPSTYVPAEPKGMAKAMVLNNILGLPSQSSCRYLDSSLAGDLRIEFVLAGNEVMEFAKQEPAGTARATWEDLSANSVNGALSYTINKFHLTCECIQIANGVYSELQRAKIAEQEFITYNYKDYYTQESSGKGTSNNTRFSASSQSVDWLLATMRDTTYNNIPDGATAGAYLLPNSATGLSGDYGGKESVVPLYFKFQNFNGGVAPIGSGDSGFWYSDQDPDGTFAVAFRCNGVQHPQIPSSEVEAYEDMCLRDNKLKWNTDGNGCWGINNFRNGQYVACCRLSQEPDDHHEWNCARTTGFDSRNINSEFQVNHTGLSDGEKSIFVAVQTTSSLRVGAGKSVARIP